MKQLALMRLARANALTAGVQATDLIHTAAGSASVYSNGLIDRCFRDVHVAAGPHRAASLELRGLRRRPARPAAATRAVGSRCHALPDREPPARS